MPAGLHYRHYSHMLHSFSSCSDSVSFENLWIDLIPAYVACISLAFLLLGIVSRKFSQRIPPNQEDSSRDPSHSVAPKAGFDGTCIVTLKAAQLCAVIALVALSAAAIVRHVDLADGQTFRLRGSYGAKIVSCITYVCACIPLHGLPDISCHIGLCSPAVNALSNDEAEVPGYGVNPPNHNPRGLVSGLILPDSVALHALSSFFNIVSGRFAVDRNDPATHLSHPSATFHTQAIYSS